MDLSILTPTSSSSTSHLLFSPFRPNPLRLSPPFLSRRRRCRVTLPRNSAASAPSISTENVKPKVDPSIFLPKKEVAGPKSAFGALPQPARVASSVIIAAAAAAAGFGLGFRFGKSRVAGIGGAAVAGAAGGAAVLALNSSVPEVAAADLHNLVAGFDDPAMLKEEDVDGVVRKYGVSKQDETFRAELCDLYSRFVNSVIPPGAENLRGNEVEMIIKFKTTLGIDDPDAASVHMEIGRRIFRLRMGTGDREADVEQRQAFQKLIYVSTLVFGEASSFLLPWKRIFNVTDSQVDIAIRDNAQRLYALKLSSVDRGIEEKQLIDLREAQLLYKLSDEIAADMFRGHTRKLVEENISKALDIVKSRAKAIFPCF